MNNEDKLKSIITVLIVVVVLFAYYIGYFSSKLGFNALFIGGSATGVAANPSAPKAVEEPEFKQVEEVAFLELKGDEYAKGNNSSNIVLVEFSDFECPFCAKFHPSVDNAVNKNNLKLVTKHFPLSFHKSAKDYAVMFECLGKNFGANQAYTFANKLFEVNSQKGGRVSLEDGLNEAKKLGLSDSQFNSCKADTSITSKIQNNADEGMKLGINGTPALYIMNTSTKKAVRINGLVDDSVLQSEIEKLK